MSATVEFFCAGRPRTKGSTRSFARPQGGIVTMGDNPKTKAWQGVVATAAYDAGAHLSGGGAIDVVVSFFFVRPKGHYGTGRNADKLKAAAPPFPTPRNVGDVDKLIRAILDGLTGVAFADDCQVRTIWARKEWLPTRTGVEGAQVAVSQAAGSDGRTRASGPKRAGRSSAATAAR